MPNHLLVAVFDAPSFEATQKFGREPLVMAWIAYNDSEMMPVVTAEESMKFLK
jgi:hypothetical protein